MKLDLRLYRHFSWLGVGLMVVGGGYLVFAGRWQGVAVAAAFTLGSVKLLTARHALPSLFALLIVVSALLNAAGWIFNLYRDSRLLWYDEFVHFFTSASIALAIAFYLRRLISPALPGNGAFIAAVTGAAFLLGGAWEGVEWLINELGGPLDTATDLVLDAAGGFVSALFMMFMTRARKGRHVDQGRRPGEL